jgi:hypothetical protein
MMELTSGPCAYGFSPGLDAFIGNFAKSGCNEGFGITRAVSAMAIGLYVIRNRQT